MQGWASPARHGITRKNTNENYKGQLSLKNPKVSINSRLKVNPLTLDWFSLDINDVAPFWILSYTSTIVICVYVSAFKIEQCCF